jgi:hypothetical protein
LNERAKNREEASTAALNGGGVHAILIDRPIPIEQVFPGYSHVREVEATVIDAVQTPLGPVVFSADSRQEAVLVTQRDIQRVNAVVLASDNQLGKDDCGFTVQRSVTDVVLPRTPMGV